MFRFLRDRRGSVSVAFALLLPVVAGMTAGVVDYVSIQRHMERLQLAADASALAAASHIDLSLASNPAALRKARAERVFHATINNSEGLENVALAFADADPRFTITATADFTPYLGLLALTSTIKLSADATAERRVLPTEMVLALDSTASMAITGSWAGARDRLIAAVGYIRDAIPEESDLYMSFVPFSDRVNLGSAYRNWLVSNPPSNWKGCFRPREEPEAGFPHALTDTPPDQLKFEYSVKDTEPAWRKVRWGGIACKAPITPPTTSLEDIEDALHLVTTGGTGRFDQGLAWAWRMVSPRWAGHWGHVNYPQPAGAVRKVVIYIADGKASVNQPMSQGGMGEHDQLPPSGRNVMSQGHADHLVEICRKMREQGIQLFMIAPKVTLPIMEDAMGQCAVGGSRYFRVTDDDELEGALEDIVREITQNVRLVE